MLASQRLVFELAWRHSCACEEDGMSTGHITARPKYGILHDSSELRGFPVPKGWPLENPFTFTHINEAAGVHDPQKNLLRSFMKFALLQALIFARSLHKLLLPWVVEKQAISERTQSHDCHQHGRSRKSCPLVQCYHLHKPDLSSAAPADVNTPNPIWKTRLLI